jgi:hypothetical protein
MEKIRLREWSRQADFEMTTRVVNFRQPSRGHLGKAGFSPLQLRAALIEVAVPDP